jgi:hypothetical protein
MNLGVMFGYRHADLNRFNRPVRTRMPGGVAGERPLWLPPMPISSFLSGMNQNLQEIKLPAFRYRKFAPDQNSFRECDNSRVWANLTELTLS